MKDTFKRWRTFLNEEKIDRIGKINTAWAMRDVLAGPMEEEIVTKDQIHQLADKLNIPWDDDPEFKNWTKNIAGKSHLDDMSKDELSTVYSALKKRGIKEKESEQTDEL
jgi:hypothetical protein